MSTTVMIQLMHSAICEEGINTGDVLLATVNTNLQVYTCCMRVDCESLASYTHI